MAKSNGILKIEGTLDELTFYNKDGKSFVRKKGGVSKERIENDPNYVRTRENNAEFSHSTNAAKTLRMALGSLVFKAKDNKLSPRMMQMMSRVKNLDLVSARGQRQVGIGFEDIAGKDLLKGFDFNINARLQSVLFAPYTLNVATGVLTIPNLIPAEQLLFPTGATHVSLQNAVLAIDFVGGASQLAFSPIVNLPINLTQSSPALTPTSVPASTGLQLFLIIVSFYQEVNGVQYSLKNEEYNVLNVLEVV